MNLRNLFRGKGASHQHPKSIALSSEDESNDEAEDLPQAVRVTDVLDLHGFYPEQVPEMVLEFVNQAEELNIRSLRIIHGKGKSKLKWIVINELKRHPRVASYRDAPPELGGWGSTLVFLHDPRHLGQKPSQPSDLRK